MTTTLILGGGFGGLACARALRQRLPTAHRIVLVDPAWQFVVGAAKTWVALGERGPDGARRDRASLLPAGVEWVRAAVTRLDPAKRRVETGAGVFEGEHLVIALGAELDPAAIPGLDRAHSFYTLEDAVRLREALSGFEGGRLLLLIARPPFKCPPAPYEAMMLIEAALRERGRRERVTLEVWTAEPAPMPTAGAAMGQAIRSELEARGIAFHPRRQAVEVRWEGRAGTVRFADSSETAFDLLVAVPPHRVPGVVVEAGLAEATGWIDVDPIGLEAKAPGAAAHVYAVGDVTRVSLPGRYDPAAPLVLPKAGVFAAAEGEVVASRIAASVLGGEAAGFAGEGFCYLEVGEGRAIRAEGSFFRTPHPEMRASSPDPAQYRDKLRWVEGWLAPPA